MTRCKSVQNMFCLYYFSNEMKLCPSYNCNFLCQLIMSIEGSIKLYTYISIHGGLLKKKKKNEPQIILSIENDIFIVH